MTLDPKLLFIGRIETLLTRLNLTLDEVTELRHLMNHGEPVEGIRTLAYILDAKNISIPPDIHEEILCLVDGLVPSEHMPLSFQQQTPNHAFEPTDETPEAQS